MLPQEDRFDRLANDIESAIDVGANAAKVAAIQNTVRGVGDSLAFTGDWEMAIETLGSSGSGGWAFDAATGPTSAPVVTAWGVPVYRDVNLPVGRHSPGRGP